MANDSIHMLFIHSAASGCSLRPIAQLLRLLLLLVLLVLVAPVPPMLPRGLLLLPPRLPALKREAEAPQVVREAEAAARQVRRRCCWRHDCEPPDRPVAMESN